MLSEDDLRPVDVRIVEYLAEHPLTPEYAKQRLEEEGEEYTRGYVQQRLGRLVEHDHAEKLLDTSMYRLTDDPRNSDANDG